MRIQAWAPGHATFVFATPENLDTGNDPLQKGSLGVGINFNAGVITKIEESDDLRVYWNNEEISGTVSRTVYDLFVKETGVSSPVTIYHGSELKIGHGLSTSGAGALGTALALNKLFDTKLEDLKLYQLAHIADVVNHTGLGSVMGQLSSGIEVRKKIGGPGIGESISFKSDEQLIILMLGKLETSEVLTSKEKMKLVNKTGLDIISRLDLDHVSFSLPFLFSNSLEFARNCGLMTQKVEDLSNKLLEINEPMHTMAMIGETLVVKPNNPQKILEIARKYSIPAVVTQITSQIPFVL